MSRNEFQQTYSAKLELKLSLISFPSPSLFQEIFRSCTNKPSQHPSKYFSLLNPNHYSPSEMPTSKRKWAPKSQGGCRTCKSRHVRCDQTLPICTPCQKSSRQCEYTTSSSSTSSPTPSTSTTPLKTILYQPTQLILHPHHTQEELRALSFFRAKVAVNLSGLFASTFWTNDILQVAQQEDSVRHAVVALASLFEGMFCNYPDKHEEEQRNRLEAFAVRQHRKAISHLNYTVQKGSRNGEVDVEEEVVLTTCAPFICFEMFRGNYDAALRHMCNGVYVLFNCVAKPASSARLSNQLERLFGRLMLQVILFIDAKPPEWKFVQLCFKLAPPAIPPVFADVEEARDCLDACMGALYHGMLASLFQGLGDGDLDIGPMSQQREDPLDAWSSSFQTFLAEKKESFSAREKKIALLLEIQHLTASILAAAGPSSQEIVFDSFEESFSRIVTLTSPLLLTNTPKDAGPSFPDFETGILPHLYFVASRCRHPVLRREALCLLRKGPRQEGIWHRDMLAGIAERIMDVEGRGACSAGNIPASERLTVIGATIDSVQRRVVLHCCRQESGVEEIEAVHELVGY